MPPNHPPMLEEIYKLTKENNKLLRKMHRHAIWGRIITLVFYAALLLAPIWFYQTYLSGTMQQLLDTYQKVQGTGQQAQGQFQQIQQMLKDFSTKLPSFGSASTSPQQ